MLASSAHIICVETTGAPSEWRGFQIVIAQLEIRLMTLSPSMPGLTMEAIFRCCCFFLILQIYFFLAVLGLPRCAGFSLIVTGEGYFLVVVV